MRCRASLGPTPLLRQNPSVKILIVDDQALFREGLKLILANLRPEAAAIEAGALDEAMRSARQHPDIALVLFNLGLPGTQGIDALSQFRREHEHLPLVALSGQDDQQTVLDALTRGAMGLVPKTASALVLQTALETVLDHGVYVPPRAPWIRSSPASRHSGVAGKRLSDLGLTHRQTEVFRLVVQGKSNKAIANELQIAVSTIKQHVKPILRTLGVTSRVGAILEVVRLGIALDS
jgi:DNA-binding NarL/FixJ family response regulator